MGSLCLMVVMLLRASRVYRRVSAILIGSLIAPYVLNLLYNFDTVRLYHAGSVLGQLIDTIVHPDPGTDSDLGDVLTKIKGKWKWAPVEGPATSTDMALSS